MFPGTRNCRPQRLDLSTSLLQTLRQPEPPLALAALLQHLAARAWRPAPEDHALEDNEKQPGLPKAPAFEGRYV